MFDLTISTLLNMLRGIMEGGGLVSALSWLLPFLLFFEIPLALFNIVGVLKHCAEEGKRPVSTHYLPLVSCILTCYNEGKAIEDSLHSVLEQTYRGVIQVIVVIDGAAQNKSTYDTAVQFERSMKASPGRKLIIVPKFSRGGLVSSANAALNFAEGEIVIRLDGDSLLANDAVAKIVRRFSDSNVVAACGNIKVRNEHASVWAKLQSIEYFLAINFSKTASSAYGALNNISGAFGIFRKEILQKIGGWNAGTAEDLDITIRIKSYYKRSNKKFRLIFIEDAVCYTDVPETLKGFYRQRLRWDGDYPYIIKKHAMSITPGLIGWKNFLWEMLNMFTLPVTATMIYFYTAYMLLCYPLPLVFALNIILYAVYLTISGITYIIGLVLLSTDVKNDLLKLPLLLFYPLFMFSSRINSFLAILWEVVGKQHQGSSMLPYYIAKKIK